MSEDVTVEAVQRTLRGQSAEEKTISDQYVTSDVPTSTDLPKRGEADVAHIEDEYRRYLAVHHYNRTVEEFRRTGTVPDWDWKDFSEYGSAPSRYAAFNAYADAASDLKEYLYAQTLEREEGGFAGAGDRPVAPAPLPRAGNSAGLIRGISFDPDLPGRNARFEPAIPLLDVAPVPAQLPPVDDQTEALLNAMIGECHFLMRAVAFPSMCHAGVADDRLNWLDRAMGLAKTGATVAKAVARLRHGPSIRESHQKITVENKVAVVQGGGGCANP
jgi:hypothetical protein